MVADGSMVTGVGVWWLAHTLADQEAELGTFESQQLFFTSCNSHPQPNGSTYVQRGSFPPS